MATNSSTSALVTGLREPVSQLHSRVNDLDDNNGYNSNREYSHREVWRRLRFILGIQRDGVWQSRRFDDNVQHDQCWRRVSTGNCIQTGWSCRNARHYTYIRDSICNKFIIGVLSVISLSTPATANEGTTAIANPVATSSGQVSNQAVQINQGGYSKQGYAPGHYCNSSTLTVTPFYLGNDTHPNYVRSQNFGMQMTLSFPLDGGMVETCKALARKRLEKERLDYMLIRAIKCAELMRSGFMIHPNSPYSVVCSDVVPIARGTKSAPPSSEASAPASPPASEQVLKQTQDASSTTSQTE